MILNKGVKVTHDPMPKILADAREVHQDRDFEFVEFFGGGAEYLPFLTPPLWPFSLLRLFRQEEK